MKRNMRLILLVVGVLAVGGLLAAGYFLLAEPYLARVKAVEKAEADARRVDDDLTDLQTQARKLKPLEKRGLPAGVNYPDDPKRSKREYAEVAKQEYETALTKILKDAGARNATVNFIDGESNNKAGIPQMDTNYKPNNASDPAEYLTYTQIVYKVEIPKTDLGTIGDVLRRYYSLDLLHQITHLSIRQTTANELGQDERPAKERADLKVEITTRAIIINGAERRRSLSPAPSPLIGLVAGIGAVPYQQSTSLSRKLPPPPSEPILAVKPRDYALLPAKDPFHGSIKPYPDFVDKGPAPPPPPPPAKPDLREFIVFTTSIHSQVGNEHSVEIVIKDKINQDEYQVVVTQIGEKVVAKVTKFYFDNFKTNPADRKKKEYMNEPTLDISKFTMSNKNNFTVYGVDTDGSLIIGERPTLPEPAKEEKKPAVGGGGGRPQPPAKPTLPPPDPKAALIGGPVVFAPRAEKFYRWKSGDSLKQIVELSKTEADAAIRRAQTRFLPTPTSTPTGTSPEAKGGE